MIWIRFKLSYPDALILMIHMISFTHFVILKIIFVIGLFSLNNLQPKHRLSKKWD